MDDKTLSDVINEANEINKASTVDWFIDNF
jgi:hypothetical protein